MRSDMVLVLSVLIVGILCIVGVAGYIMYDNMQKQNEELQNNLVELESELNDTKDELNDTKNAMSSKSTKSSTSSSSSSGKVTYEEAGVNKYSGYIKTCKYPGCGARYNSTLSRCPKCGQKNIYV